MKIALPLLMLLLTVSGCTVSTDISLQSNMEGTAVSRISMAPLLRRYLADLSQVQGIEVTDATSFFDIAALTAGFAADPGLNLIGAVQEDPRILKLYLKFDDLQRIFPPETAPEGSPVISRSRGNGTETVVISISRENVAAVMQIIPMGNDPVSQTITGIFEAGGDEAELVEMLSWVFEEYAPAEEVQEMIRTAAVELSITVEGTLVKVEGGSSADSRTASFAIPLVRFFSLEKPLEYSFSYTPED